MHVRYNKDLLGRSQILKSDPFPLSIVVGLSVLILFLSLGALAATSLFYVPAFASQGQTDINASNVYKTHTMIAGKSVKNLVILIPNEAHESTDQPKNQQPLINQPYIPQNATVNVGTAITWFHADVDHKHTITLNDKDSGNTVFKTKPFSFNTATQPFTLNKTGSFEYFEKNVNNAVPDFVMKGTISVLDDRTSLNSTGTSNNVNSSSPNNFDTVGTYMVPAKDVEKYVSQFKERGFNIDSIFTYKDLRGGQKGTGPEQALLVWTSSGMTLDKVISSLEDITPKLPYS